MNNILFYTLGIGFASGIFFRSFFIFNDVATLALFATALALGLLWRLRSKKRHSALLLGSIVLIAFGFGVFRYNLAEEHISSLGSEEGKTVTITGTVVREPQESGKNLKVTVEQDSTNERILVTTDRYENVEYGDVVRARGSLREPRAFETDIGRTFNYPEYLKSQDILYELSFATVTVTGQNAGNRAIAVLYRVKHTFEAALERALPEPSAGLGEGLLLGEKRALGNDLSEVFRTAGIVHIIVLSGYNVMIVIEAVMRLFAFQRAPRLRLMLGLIIIVGFASLVGFSATVLRASIMAGLLLIARATGRTYRIMRALVFAGVVMLILDPYLLAFDPGFALSFLATLGLMLVSPLIEARLARVPSGLGLRETLTSTIATQFFVLPYLLYQMGTLSLVALPVNLLVLPMVPYAMLLTFLTGVAGLILPFLGMLVGFTAHASLLYIIGVAERFAALPFASVTVPSFPFWMVVVAYTAYTIILIAFHRRSTRTTLLPEPQDSAPDTDYSDWVIEEVTDIEKSPRKTRSVSRGDSAFPF